MLITITNEPNLTLIGMPNQIVFGNAETLKTELADLFEQGHKNLSLNLSEVNFIDSSGLAVLVAALKRAEREGGQLSLLSPSDNARMLIELTRLHQIFDIYEDAEALKQAVCAV